MNIKLKMADINMLDFFQNYYIVAFFISLIGAVIFSSAIFYYSLNRNTTVLEIGAGKEIDKELVLKVNELLDAREKYFQELRSLKASIKNPF